MLVVWFLVRVSLRNSLNSANESHHYTQLERRTISSGGLRLMKSVYNGQAVPAEGKAIGYSGGELQVPDTPIIPLLKATGRGGTSGRHRGGCLMRRWSTHTVGNGRSRGLRFSAAKKRSTRIKSGCGTKRSRRFAIFV